MSIFNIDPDIRRAETLSAEFYTDETWFHLSKDRIFARTWQLAAVSEAVDNIHPFILLEEFLDEPLVLTRSGNDFRCLSNVCTHRGKIVAEEACQANGLRCGYHGRRFGLDGGFLSMPEFEGTVDFPTERDDLRKFAHESRFGLSFVSLDPVAPIAEFFSDAENLTRGLYRSPMRFAGSSEYLVQAHWALYCENYLEGFHVPYVHPSLNKAIDYETYRTEIFRHSSVQIAHSDENSFPNSVAAYYFFVFPNLMLNFYPWGLSVNLVKPERPDLTRVSYLTFIADEAKFGSGAGADLNTVELEDQAVVESVQRGIRSRFYDRGRYSPTREQGTHHFHRLIAEYMQV